MTQTSILLCAARRDWLQALNMMSLIKFGSTPYTIDDVMFAYLIAKEWCYWIENRQAPDSPLYGSEADDASLLRSFRDKVHEFEQMLTDQEPLIAQTFQTFNPCLLELCHQGESALNDVKESTKDYIASLCVTADFFEKSLGKPQYAEILRSKTQ